MFLRCFRGYSFLRGCTFLEHSGAHSLFWISISGCIFLEHSGACSLFWILIRGCIFLEHSGAHSLSLISNNCTRINLILYVISIFPSPSHSCIFNINFLIFLTSNNHIIFTLWITNKWLIIFVFFIIWCIIHCISYYFYILIDCSIG